MEVNRPYKFTIIIPTSFNQFASFLVENVLIASAVAKIPVMKRIKGNNAILVNTFNKFSGS